MKLIAPIKLTLFCYIIIACLGLHENANARVMEGINQPIRLLTEILQNGEYVRAAYIVTFFPNRWQYDGLSESLIITRQDGVHVGVSVKEHRVVVGNRVFTTGTPLIRNQGHIYIPFHIVSEFLLPEVEFKEVEAGSIQPSDLSSTTPLQPTPFLLTKPTVTPDLGTIPTQSQIVLPNNIDDLLMPTQPIPTPQIRQIPRAIIVLDPGLGKSKASESDRLGVSESDITFSVTRKLAALLTESPNLEVFITQQEHTDSPLTAEERAGIANQNNADLFVSIQCGNQFTESVSRAVVFYMNPQLDALPDSATESNPSTGQAPRWDDAYKIHVSESFRLARAFNLRLRSFYSSANIIAIDTDPRPSRLAVLRGLISPGILIELGNLANRETAQHLSRDRIQEDLAYYLYQAITDFLYERTGFQYSPLIQTN